MGIYPDMNALLWAPMRRVASYVVTFAAGYSVGRWL